MAILKAILTADEFGEIDEGLQGLYKSVADGRHVLDADGLDAHPSIQPLVTTLGRYKEIAPDARRLKARLDEADRVKSVFGDLDPDDVTAKLERLAELESADGGEDLAVHLARQKKALEEQQQKALAAKDTLVTEKEADIAKRDRFIERLVIDHELDAALGKVKVIEDYRPAVRALMRDRRPKVVVDGEDGDEQEYKGVFSTDIGEVGIADYIESWARSDEAKPFLPASGNEGSGARGGGSGGDRGRANPWKKETFNLTEQGKIAKENPALAKQLAAAAGKSLQVA